MAKIDFKKIPCIFGMHKWNYGIYGYTQEEYEICETCLKKRTKTKNKPPREEQKEK